MRTNIDIDDELMRSALARDRTADQEGRGRGGAEASCQAEGPGEDQELRGKIDWEGDLDEMRRDRLVDHE